ncbi:MAG: hypothetical protein NC121_08485 [Blautia sp.]|nr:hypothetical protein [Blautia sp.]
MAMQNGKNISELIQKLQTGGTQWQELVSDENSEGDNKVVQQIRRLYRMLRQELKEGDEEEIRMYLQQEQLRQEVIDALIKRTKEMLVFYRAFSPLRELENKNKEALKGLISAVYQKYVVRYEPGYLNRIAADQYDREHLADVVERINYLTEFYVSRSYNMPGMMRDMQDETGLSPDSCTYWAEIIEQNYQALKMNYILEELKEIRRMSES